MEHIIQVCIPVFGLCVLGYCATRFSGFSTESAEGLARFVFDWAVPFALFRLFSSQVLPFDFPWELLASFYLPVLFLYLLVYYFSPLVFGLDSMEKAIAAMGSTYGNSILLGLPLMLLAFGDEGTIPYVVLISVHSLLLLSLTLALLELGKQKRLQSSQLARRVVFGLLSNPILIGIGGGLLFSYLGIALADPVIQIMHYMQQAVTACSLFALGALLTRYKVAGRLRETATVVLLKNVALPIMVWACARYVFGLDAVETIAAVVLAALPAGVNLYIVAERFCAGQQLATTTVFISTVLSMLTLTITLVYLRQIL